MAMTRPPYTLQLGKLIKQGSQNCMLICLDKGSYCTVSGLSHGAPRKRLSTALLLSLRSVLL